MSTKHILFYSNFCPYSKEVLQAVTKSNIQAMFMLICVDDRKYQLPNFVDRVPLVVASIDGRNQILKDEHITNFLNVLAHKNKPQDLDTLDWFSHKVSYSDGFSFLGGDTATLQQGGGGADTGAGLMYAYIGSENQHIETPPETSERPSTHGKNASGPYAGRSSAGVHTRGGGGSDLERLIELRANDIQRIIKEQNTHPAAAF